MTTNLLKKFMEEELLHTYKKLLEDLSWVSNRRLSQTNELFQLCDNSFSKLLELEAKLKRHFVFATPSTKEEVDVLLKVDNFYKDFEYENARDKMLSVMGYKVNKEHGCHEKII